MNDESHAIFARRGWLAHQPTDFRQAVIGLGQPVMLAAGRPVFIDGDDGGGIYGVVTGAIGCEVATALTGPTLLHVIQPGWWFGEGPALFDRQRNMSFYAIEASHLLLVTLSALRGLEAADPATVRRLGQLAELAAVKAMEAACELLIRDARQRIAAVLLRVTAAFDGITPDDPRGFRITQSQLAEMSNASRHHTNVALLEMRDGGLIALDYGRIAVLKPDLLANFARGELANPPPHSTR